MKTVKVKQIVGEFCSDTATESQQAINLLELCGFRCKLGYANLPRVNQRLWFYVNYSRKEFIMTSLHWQSARKDAVWRFETKDWSVGDHWHCGTLKDFYEWLNGDFS